MKAVSIRQIPESYRDEGVSAPGSGKLSCDPTFNRYAAQWLLGTSLDSAYAAIEGLCRLREPRARVFIDSYIPTGQRLLAKHFDSETGLFRADGSERTRGIFACHAAIGIMRSFENIPCDPISISRTQKEPALTSDRYDAMVGKLPVKRPDKPPHESVRQLIAECAATSPIPGALVDTPGSPVPPTLTVLYTASTVLWNLFRDEAVERFFQLIDEGDCRRFIERCIREDSLGRLELAGFTAHPASEELCANSTFFGLKLLERLHLLDLVLDSSFKRKIENFLLGISYHDGGFASTPAEIPSLNATFLALRALEILLPVDRFADFLRDHAPRIREFAERCSSLENGGARFAPSDRFVENCLATRYRLQLFMILDETAPGSRLPSAEDWAARTYDFFVSCYDSGTGGFYGYPPDRLKMDVSDPRRWLCGYLAQRDEVLQEALRQPKLELELAIDRCYREIGDLYTQRDKGGTPQVLDTRISVLEQRLDELQAREVDALRERVKAHLGRLGAQLEAGEAALEEVRALRSKYGDPPATHRAP